MKHDKVLKHSTEGDVRRTKGIMGANRLVTVLNMNLRNDAPLKIWTETSPNLSKRKKRWNICSCYSEYVNTEKDAGRTFDTSSVTSFGNTRSSFTANPVKNCWGLWAGPFLSGLLYPLSLEQQGQHEPRAENTPCLRTSRLRTLRTQRIWSISQMNQAVGHLYWTS